jgi:hypothetical protein
MFVNKVGQNKKWDGLQTLTMEKEMWFIITGFTAKIVYSARYFTVNQ